MTSYVLKDKARQAKLDELSETNKFSTKLKQACYRELKSEKDFVSVGFGQNLNHPCIAGGDRAEFYEYIAFIKKDEIEAWAELPEPYQGETND